MNFIYHCAALLFGFMRYYYWSLLLTLLSLMGFIICISPPKLSSLTSDFPFEFKMFKKGWHCISRKEWELFGSITSYFFWKKQLTSHFSETTSDKGDNIASIWNTGGPKAIVWIWIFFTQCYLPKSILNSITMHCLFFSSCHCSIWSIPLEKKIK